MRILFLPFPSLLLSFVFLLFSTIPQKAGYTHAHTHARRIVKGETLLTLERSKRGERGGSQCQAVEKRAAAKQTTLPRNFRKNGQSAGKTWRRSRYFKPPFRLCNRGHCLLLVKQLCRKKIWRGRRRGAMQIGWFQNENPTANDSGKKTSHIACATLAPKRTGNMSF